MEILRTAIEPASGSRVSQTLNPEYRSAARNFYATSDATVTSNDPRLYDTRRNIQTQLSDPPNQSRVNPFSAESTYGPNAHAPKNSASFYKTYYDINAGQVRYYVDSEIKNTVFKPLFTNPATTVVYNYRTPMGTIKPQYIRVPLMTTNPASNPNGIPRTTLSFLEDTTATREDLMMTQMNKENSRKWSSL
jgi:hypothetical protein